MLVRFSFLAPFGWLGEYPSKWLEHYDHTYIDTVIIQNIEKRIPELHEIVKLIEKKATGGVP